MPKRGKIDLEDVRESYERARERVPLTHAFIFGTNQVLGHTLARQLYGPGWSAERFLKGTLLGNTTGSLSAALATVASSANRAAMSRALLEDALEKKLTFGPQSKALRQALEDPKKQKKLKRALERALLKAHEKEALPTLIPLGLSAAANAIAANTEAIPTPLQVPVALSAPLIQLYTAYRDRTREADPELLAGIALEELNRKGRK